MKLHIVGHGVVGTATGEGFRHFGHTVVYTDKGDAHAEIEADMHFVCTPEAVAPDVVRELAKAGSVASKGLIVIRSSVPPGITNALAHECGTILFHNPEFLRAGVSEFEFLDSDYAVVGATIGIVDGRIINLYELMGKKVYACSSTESELLKLITNCYLATNISFWNEMGWLCRLVGANSHVVARLAILDPRVSRYGAVQHGSPYGGACLPKDVQQMLDFADQHALELGVDSPPWLLSAVKTINERMGAKLEEEKPSPAPPDKTSRGFLGLFRRRSQS